MFADHSQPLFEGDRDGVRSYLASKGNGGFYTYLLLHPDGRPFYVGKGKGQRVLQHELEALRQSNLRKTNPFKCNTIRRIVDKGGAIGYRIDRHFAEPEQLACLVREESLIALYKRRCDGGTLTNLAAGLGSLFAPDPFSTARHANTLAGLPKDNPERAALNQFIRGFGEIGSVPIKPLSQYRRQLAAAMSSSKSLLNISPRNCYTLIAACVATGVRLQPGVIIPRRLVVTPDPDVWPAEFPYPGEVEAVIENGAASDLLKLGLVTLIPARRPEDEAFTLDSGQIARLQGAIGRPTLQRWDLV